MNPLGMIRVAAVAPKLLVANPQYNVDEMIRCAKEAREHGASVILFPELSIPGYSCADCFTRNSSIRKI